MTGIILSIILVLGGAGSPSGDFLNNATAVDQPVATPQSTATVQRKK